MSLPCRAAAAAAVLASLFAAPVAASAATPIQNTGPALTGGFFVLTSTDPDVACITSAAIPGSNLGSGESLTLGSLDPAPPGFTFRASDGSLASNVASVSLTVRPVNDAPTAANQAFAVPENSANGTLVGVFQASDVDGDRLTFAITAGNTGGAFGRAGAEPMVSV